MSIVAFFGLSCGVSLAALAAEQPGSVEDYVLKQVRGGQMGNPKAFCNPQPPDPRTSRAAPGRRCNLSGAFLRNLVTHAKGFETDAAVAIAIDDADIEGDIDLRDATIDRPLRITHGKIHGAFRLAHAKATRAVAITDSTLDGDLAAQGFQTDFGLDLGGTTVTGAASMVQADIKATTSLARTTFFGGLAAHGLHVDGSLILDRAKVKSLNLDDGRIAGSLSLDGAEVAETAELNRMQIGSSLFAKALQVDEDLCRIYRTHLTNLSIKRTRVAVNIEMNGIEVPGLLDASGVQVGGNVYLKSQGADHNEKGCNLPQIKAELGQVDLHYASIGGSLLMDKAVVESDFTAIETMVAGDVSLRDVEFRRSAVLASANLRGNLDVQGARLSDLDLSEARIDGTLRFAEDADPLNPAVWNANRARYGLTLTNTRVGFLAGTLESQPQSGKLHLGGLTFAHVPVDATTGEQARDEAVRAWEEWIGLDPQHVPAVYEQLATSFASAGFKDAADDIRYRGRVRAMDEETWGAWLASLMLRVVAGFGIGARTFRVLWWIVGITLLGAIYLHNRHQPNTRTPYKFLRHDPSASIVWCIGATLSRLLPIIEVNKEFTDFFDDPKRERLTKIQSFVFSIIGLVGWLLGIVLLSAVTGLFSRT